MLRLVSELVVIPILVGIVVELFAYWLNKRDDDQSCDIQPEYLECIQVQKKTPVSHTGVFRFMLEYLNFLHNYCIKLLKKCQTDSR